MGKYVAVLKTFRPISRRMGLTRCSHGCFEVTAISLQAGQGVVNPEIARASLGRLAQQGNSDV